MGKLLITLFYVSISTCLYSQTIEAWQVLPSSTLIVNGKTNINTFNCDIDAYNDTDTINYISSTGDVGYLTSGSMNISIISFDCHHKMMTKDLRKTLKYKDFPLMTIEFISLSNLISENKNLSGNIIIYLAGKSKEYSVSFISTSSSSNSVKLSGTQSILLSDFDLKPPSKLGGMIKVKDEMTVDIELILNRIN
ncbi:MAG TPA: hypothetical protein PK147_00035 [Saprospiraceae bacterium]|nr:YceI family protein [Saprospiraceae bacterium]MCB9328107.1 YceI family protein [Lewinellaceae bacterium]HPK09023.1 hypothetical protein [Saprospiraceae bacterium]HPQ20201.1 hypothetical protein [Saprospiraceae bacterium]